LATDLLGWRERGRASMKFHASRITCLVEDGVAMLGFADDDINTTHYLLLQRTLEPNPEDRRLGMDQVHVELNSQIQSAYGNVEEARLRKRGVVFRLDPATAAKVSDGEAIDVTIDMTPEKMKEVADQLRLLIGEKNVRVAPQKGTDEPLEVKKATRRA
jgi:hypothetical protein